MNAIIGTWKMSFQGLTEAKAMLETGASAGDAIVQAISRVEENPAFMSVGYGGLPGRDGHVTLDAGFMDGHSLRVGGVMSVENIFSPIRAARLLCGRETNCLLAGRGGRQRIPAVPGVKCVDTTSAGDTFAAAFIAALLEGKPLVACGRFANAAASLCVERVGATSGTWTRADVDARLQAAYL